MSSPPLQTLLVVLVALVIGVAAALVLALESSDAPALPANEAGPVGVYRSRLLPAASSPGRIVELAVRGDGSAALTSDFQDGRPKIVQEGRWAVSSNGIVQIRLETTNGRALLNPVSIEFRLEGIALSSIGSAELFGSEGLRLERQ